MARASHGGARLSRHPDPEVRARKAFEQAFQPGLAVWRSILHLQTRLCHVGHGGAEELWTRRQIALDSIGESSGVRSGTCSNRSATVKASRHSSPTLGTQSRGVPQGILFFNPLDSVTVAHQVELLDRRSSTVGHQGRPRGHGVYPLVRAAEPWPPSRGRAVAGYLAHPEPGFRRHSVGRSAPRGTGQKHRIRPFLPATKTRPVSSDLWMVTTRRLPR